MSEKGGTLNLDRGMDGWMGLLCGSHRTGQDSRERTRFSGSGADRSTGRGKKKLDGTDGMDITPLSVPLPVFLPGGDTR